MKVSQAISYHLQYHKANSQLNTQRCVEYVLGKFHNHFNERDLASVSEEDVLNFLNKPPSIGVGQRQHIKFYDFIF